MSPDRPHPADLTLSATASASLPALASDARARVSGDGEPGATIGRYVVLARLGAGGMGVVFAAHDPELDRKVALKLLRPDARSADGARLLREARSLARLDHPNVVPVHDVGVVGDQVFVAMEFVEGVTLRRWLGEERRSTAAILEVFRAAGRGLAAAHQAGIVHRDFKPDNVMIGVDGRVRVLDFGLARDDDELVRTGEQSRRRSSPPLSPSATDLRLTREGALMGTPAYMAPEQWRGEPTTARSDLFAFAVALWEALYGERPHRAESVHAIMSAVIQGRLAPPPRGARRVPAALHRELERALAVAPSRRHASMEALLAALDRAEGEPRRRALVLGASFVAALGLGAAGTHVHRTIRCEQAGASIAEVWSDDAKAALEATLERSGASYAATSLERASARLDDYGREWSALRTQACLEDGRDPVIGAGASDCLDEHRDALAGLLEAFAGEGADPERLVPAVAGLPRLAPCVEQGALARRSALPADPATRARALAIRRRLAEVQGRWDAGRRADIRALADGVLADAEALGYAPLIADARYLAGRASIRDDRERGVATIRRAYVDAGALGDDPLAAAAAITLVALVDVPSPRSPPQWTATAEMLVARVGEERGLLGARLQARQGTLHRARGEFAAAIERYQEARAIFAEVLGRDHPEVADTLSDLASVQRDGGDPDGARASLREALALRQESLGGDHPRVAATFHELGRIEQVRGDFAAAAEHFERALAMTSAAHGAGSLAVAEVENSYGRLLHLRGELARADALLRDALAIREAKLGPDAAEVATSLQNLGLLELLRGDRLAAREHLERALAIREAKLGPSHPAVLELLDNLGTLAYRLGDLARALALHQRALDLQRQSLGPSHPAVAHSLRNLALVQRRRGDEAEALRLARDALAVGEAALGAEHPDIAAFLNTLGLLLRRTDPTAAEAHVTRALAISRARRGDRHPATATSHLRLGELLSDRKDAAGARDHLATALAIREEVARESPEVAEVLVALGELDLGARAGEDAASRFERALALLGGEGVAAYDLAEAEFGLARALAGRDDARARALAEAALRRYQGAGAGFRGEVAACEAWLRR